MELKRKTEGCKVELEVCEVKSSTKIITNSLLLFGK